MQRSQLGFPLRVVHAFNTDLNLHDPSLSASTLHGPQTSVPTPWFPTDWGFGVFAAVCAESASQGRLCSRMTGHRDGTARRSGERLSRAATLADDGISITMDVYTHVLHDTQREAISHMDRLLKGRLPAV
ncbi:hypothetical protein ACFWGO_00010 [Streptomyces griseoaurantiacus]|uniref:hypothetical protein n=1 Tax=Streptomyces griseoaurantiacus TaxID=68213 RepID=UPI00362BF86E